ncbi:MAG: hypothetical protein RLY31_1538 [Bacteroidota bacterium]|jgi:two-component system LytT family response regulator
MPEQTLFSAVLIDEEQQSLDLMNRQIQTFCPDIRVIATCSTANNGLAAIRKLQPDIVFIDIQMPFLNGLDLLQGIPKINFAVVFTTAYNKDTIHALEMNSLDYLLKPVMKDRLLVVVKKFRQQMVKNTGFQDTSLQMLLKRHLQPFENKIAVTIQDSILFLEVNSIIYIQSESNYSYIYLKDGRAILSSKNLLVFEELLTKHRFIRIHASSLVNLEEIMEYKKKGGGSVIMSNGEEIRVSRNRRYELLDLI